MLSDQRTFTHWIDGDDRVIAVNEAWRAFARENDAPDLADFVLGRRLWDFVRGLPVVGVWRTVIDHCRETMRVATIPYRCDAPGMRRLHSMRITATADRGVEFASHIVWREPRDEVRLPLEAGANGGLVKMCAWCKKVRLPTDAWCELDAAGPHLGLTEEPVPSISHGMCPECLATASLIHEASA